MKKNMKIAALVLSFILFALPFSAFAQKKMSGDFVYDYRNFSFESEIEITGYKGSSGVVSIPGEIDGLPVTSIAPEAFRGKDFIYSFSFPASVNHIGDYAFFGTGWLKNYADDFVIVNNILIEYKGNSTAMVYVPDNVEVIGYGAFDYSVFKDVFLPSGLLEIYPYAFYSCENLEYIYIPENVKFLDNSAFNACSRLFEIAVSENNKNYSSAGGALFDKSQERLIYAPKGLSGKYAAPSSLKIIDKQAFKDCTSLLEVVLPEGLAKIDDEVFSGCSSLTKINIPNTVKSIGYWAFGECITLQEVSFGSGLREIDDMAFVSCIRLKTISVSDDIEKIGDYSLGWYITERTGDKLFLSKMDDFIVMLDNKAGRKLSDSPVMNYVVANSLGFAAKNSFERALGDVDGNGKISAVDARRALRTSAKLVLLTALEQSSADINKDGKVSATDARTILRVSANLASFDLF